jgi:hypothetical protein
MGLDQLVNDSVTSNDGSVSWPIKCYKMGASPIPLMKRLSASRVLYHWLPVAS